jgi:WD40 repeat protein
MIRLWDMATGQQIGTSIDIGRPGVYALAFSPSGATLAAGGGRGPVLLWPARYLTDPVARLSAAIGGSLTRPQWRGLAGAGLPYHRVCPRV